LFHKSIKNLAGYGIPILVSRLQINNEENILPAIFRELPMSQWQTIIYQYLTLVSFLLFLGLS
jgi:hypothetical protein